MKLPVCLIVALGAALSVGAAVAQTATWKYRDAQGRVVVSDMPPPAGVKSPALWGTEARLAELEPV